MADGLNPYQAPDKLPPESGCSTASADGWKLLLLAVAVLASLTSIVPVLAIILIVLSGPALLSWYDLRLQRRGQRVESRILKWIARILGFINLAVSIFAAAAAAFLGTCSVTAWSVAMSGIGDWLGDLYSKEPLNFIIPSLLTGVAVGSVAFTIALLWLRSRLI